MIFIGVSCSTTGRGCFRRDAKFSRRLFTFFTPFYFRTQPPGPLLKTVGNALHPWICLLLHLTFPIQSGGY
jgi:hypothetical protein